MEAPIRASIFGPNHQRTSIGATVIHNGNVNCVAKVLLRHRPALKVVNTRTNAARPGSTVERKIAPTKEAGAVGYKGIT
jgi:hypothetical protein